MKRGRIMGVTAGLASVVFASAAHSAPPQRPQVIASGPAAVSADGVVACAAVLTLALNTLETDGGEAIAIADAPCKPEGSGEIALTIYKGNLLGDSFTVLDSTTCETIDEPCDLEAPFSHDLLTDPSITLRAVTEFTWTANGEEPEEKNFRFATPLYCDDGPLIEQHSVDCALAADLTIAGLG